MNAIETIEIPIDKRKILVWLAILLIMGWFGLYLIQNNSAFTNQLAKNYALPVGIAFVISAPFLVLFFASKLFDNSPGFIISDAGITDNSSSTSHGFIPWSEITEIDERQVSVRKCITISLINPQQHIDNASSGFKQFSWKGTLKRYGVPILLSTTILKCSYSDLLSLLKNGLEKYKGSK